MGKIRGVLCVCLALVCGLARADCPGSCQCSAWTITCKNAQLQDVPRDRLPPGVVKLNLSFNKISSLRNNSFPAVLASLEILLLANNEINSIQVDSFGNLNHLSVLDLSGNEIRFIEPDVFSKTTNLISLNLTNNPHLKLPDTGYKFPQLVKLELEHCHISKIPTNFFKDMRNIQFLYLSSNEISYLEPTNFKHLTNLSQLDVSDNWFKVLQRDLLELHSSTKLKLSKNPWICDCNFLSALVFYERRRNNKPLICKSPQQLRGVTASETAINGLLHCDAASRTTTTTSSAEVYDYELADWFVGDDSADRQLADLVDSSPSEDQESVAALSAESGSSRLEDSADRRQLADLVDSSPGEEQESVAALSADSGSSWLEDNLWWVICGVVVLVAAGVGAAINTQVNTRRKTHLLYNVHYNEEL